MRGTVEAGGYDTFRLAAATSGSRGDFEWGAAADRLSDGQQQRPRDAGRAHGQERRLRTNLRRGFGGWRRGEALAARAGAARDRRTRISRAVREQPARHLRPDRRSFARHQRADAGGGVGSVCRSGRGARALVQTAYNRLDSEFASPFGPSESNSSRWLGRAQMDFPLSSSLDCPPGSSCSASEPAARSSPTPRGNRCRSSGGRRATSPKRAGPPPRAFSSREASASTTSTASAFADDTRRGLRRVGEPTRGRRVVRSSRSGELHEAARRSCAPASARPTGSSSRSPTIPH